MPFLSPAKLLVILVIALVVLGPDKLPRVAKQIGGLWSDFRKFRDRLESEVRGNFPDLPSSNTITQAVRSPLSFLGNLAETPNAEKEPTGLAIDDVEAMKVETATPAVGSEVESAAVYQAPAACPVSLLHQVRAGTGVLAEDQGLN
jgi:sec-independent protein translocase protein TatB